MKQIGFFSEMNISYGNSGSIFDYLVKKVNYDKNIMVQYLLKFKHVAGCPRAGIDCVTGEPISPSFLVFNDGEYEWCDFLIYHIQNYNVSLPEAFIKKAGAIIQQGV
jgi:hypothetical protein